MVRIAEVGKFNDMSTRIMNTDWDAVFSAEDIGLKLEIFNSIIVDILDETMPLRSVRIHPSDRPWITSYIKTQIKARQLAFTRGDKATDKFICEKVSMLISRAEAAYYQIKLKDLRSSNQEKWFKTVYVLPGADKGVSNVLLLQLKTSQTWQKITNSVHGTLGES